MFGWIFRKKDEEEGKRRRLLHEQISNVRAAKTQLSGESARFASAPECAKKEMDEAVTNMIRAIVGRKDM